MLKKKRIWMALFVVLSLFVIFVPAQIKKYRNTKNMVYNPAIHKYEDYDAGFYYICQPANTVFTCTVVTICSVDDITIDMSGSTSKIILELHGWEYVFGRRTYGISYSDLEHDQYVQIFVNEDGTLNRDEYGDDEIAAYEIIVSRYQDRIQEMLYLAKNKWR